LALRWFIGHATAKAGSAFSAEMHDAAMAGFVPPRRGAFFAKIALLQDWVRLQFGVAGGRGRRRLRCI